MRKGVTFISAVLTVFVLAALAGVAYAYKDLPASKAKPRPAAGLQSLSMPSATATAAPAQIVYPQEAADIAAKYLKRTDLYSVEMSNFNSAQAYLVAFASGDTVYVSMTGQVLSAVPPQVVTYSAPAQNSNASRKGGGEDGEGDDD